MSEARIQVFRTAALAPKVRASYDRALPATLRHLLGYDKALVTITRALQNNPNLADCNPQSLIRTMIDCASLGLELGGPLQHAYPVPYKGEITLQLGYRGILELARRSGELAGPPICQWVFERDQFEMDLADTQHPITHRPYLDGPRGEPRLVYCLARFKDGGLHVDFMTHDDVCEHGKKFGGPGPLWSKHFLEAGRKTIIKRAAKHWPISVDLARAIELDERPIGEDAISDYASAEVIDAETGEVNETAGLGERVAAAAKKKKPAPRKDKDAPPPAPESGEREATPGGGRDPSPPAAPAGAPTQRVSVASPDETKARQMAELLAGKAKAEALLVEVAQHNCGLEVETSAGISGQWWGEVRSVLSEMVAADADREPGSDDE